MPKVQDAKLYLGSQLVSGLYAGSVPLLGMPQLELVLQQLWAGGEQGVWYDPAGFADSWNQVGPEVLTNNSFDAGLTGWSSFIPAGASITASDGALTFVSDGVTYAAIQQNNVMTVGALYQVTIEVLSGTPSLKVVGIDTETQFTSSTSFIGRATLANFSIARNGVTNCVIGSISVRPWYGAQQCGMYQDAAGSAFPYLPGKGRVDPPIGLLLDRRLGLSRGVDVLINGDFASGAANWGVSGENATHIATFSGEQLRFQVDTLAPALNISQSGRLVVGKWYEITTVTSAYTAGSIKTDSIVSGGSGVNFANKLGIQTYIGQAASSTFSFTRGAAVTDLTIDSITVREIKGNHAYQTTTTSRPTLSGRYNVFTNTENLGTAWSPFNGVFSISGGYWKFSESAVTGLHSFTQTPALPKAQSYRASFVGKPDGRTTVRFVMNAYTGNFAEVRFNLATGTVVGTFTGGDGVLESYSIVPTVDGAYRCTIVGKPSAATADSAFDVSLGLMNGTNSSYAGDGVSGVLVNYFDCRLSSEGINLPPYQRVVDANNYDTVGFPLYLSFDGVDDFLQTATVDFSGTDKIFATAALRKLSDSAAGIVVELSAVSNTSNGSFALLAPAGPGDTLAVYMRGATALTASIPIGIPSPTSRVFTGVMDTSAAVGMQSRSRVNGAHYAYTSQNAGGGNFGVYPLYIGRRGGTILPLNGRIYGLVIRSNFTSAAQLAAVERCLNLKGKVY